MFPLGGSTGVSVPNRSHTNEGLARANGLALGHSAGAGHRDHGVQAAAVSWGGRLGGATNEGFTAHLFGFANKTQRKPALLGMGTADTACNRRSALPVDANQIRITGLVSGFACTAGWGGLDAFTVEAASQSDRAVFVDGAT